jgi:hypothetical protein
MGTGAAPLKRRTARKGSMEELCFYGIGNGKRDHEEWKGGFVGLRILQVWLITVGSARYWREAFKQVKIILRACVIHRMSDDCKDWL